MKSSNVFYLVYTLSLLFGLLCIIFVTTWSKGYRGGFAWDGTAKMFNWHPVCMVTGLVVLYGNAILVYRLPFTWSSNKLILKSVHATLNLGALFFAVIGLLAAFGFHNKMHIPNLYSMHSWVGFAAVILFGLQWLLGFLAFLLPCTPLWLRAAYKDLHVFSGLCILAMTIAASLSGINEKLIFVLNAPNSTAPYKKLPPEAYLANTLGVLLLCFSLTVAWMLLKHEWQRPNAHTTAPSDATEPLLTEN
ncbi:cytochrome b ascorbate-dependent protein 3 [Carcharodon carcharias]|uniref:cytochrome b ascorbate-dependent protein 3 n=1 Tax=Carcharodon carcharias TaxID=13397 RepID=UPI001B7DF3E1|nr:cytochrome b ascorbate-dependent protein 3 [Carcharodon carcharias]XP_041054292.1 cytochrome b ascorbate-dependent protein 3 [Carcharodon carcharias]XP_041054293.1 cytochrome b ascorbate-dependent protein 3 [Carcharodon carcharias]